jgi:hypothetical protein
MSEVIKAEARISFFTAGVGADTLPMQLYAMIRFGPNKEMYALSSLLITATVVAVGLQRWLLRAGASGRRPRAARSAQGHRGRSARHRYLRMRVFSHHAKRLRRRALEAPPGGDAFDAAAACSRLSPDVVHATTHPHRPGSASSRAGVTMSNQKSKSSSIDRNS